MMGMRPFRCSVQGCGRVKTFAKKGGAPCPLSSSGVSAVQVYGDYLATPLSRTNTNGMVLTQYHTPMQLGRKWGSIKKINRGAGTNCQHMHSGPVSAREHRLQLVG